jgi:predicted XRE-type DNA-binding protein
MLLHQMKMLSSVFKADSQSGETRAASALRIRSTTMASVNFLSPMKRLKLSPAEIMRLLNATSPAISKALIALFDKHISCLQIGQMAGIMSTPVT